MQQHVFTIANVCRHFGVEHVVICPGSRSAPLVYAFTSIEGIQPLSMVDERSAGFVALGMAQQLQKPVVLICTSGTACLNFFPAIAEAFYQKIPLLVLTADRPPELLNQQDGQMIMQKNVFGDHVLESYELPCFEEDKTDFQLTAKIVSESLNKSMSSEGFGPVHINVPLREPLYDLPINFSLPEIDFFNSGFDTENTFLHQIPESFSLAWKAGKRKLILIGQLPPSEKLSLLLNELKKRTDVVILTDIVSNQIAVSGAPCFDSILQFSDVENLTSLEPDFILSFGGPFVSKALKIWLKQQKPAWHFRIQSGSERIDTYQNVTHFLKVDFTLLLENILTQTDKNPEGENPYQFEWNRLNQIIENSIEKFHARQIWCEPTAFKKVMDTLPEKYLLQLGNSSIVRWASWNNIHTNGIEIFCNRGTSGIDGTISTAIGSARINSRKLNILICGDLSLFYDQNGFWQNNLPANLKVIVLNNGGGNIFNWIAGPAQHPETISYFSTPNNLSIKNLANQYNLNYNFCDNFNDLNSTINQCLNPSDAPSVLELKFNPETNLKGINLFKQIKL